MLNPPAPKPTPLDEEPVLEWFDDHRSDGSVLKQPADRWMNPSATPVRFSFVVEEGVPAARPGAPWSPQRELEFVIEPRPSILVPRMWRESVSTTKCSCKDGVRCRNYGTGHRRTVVGGVAGSHVYRVGPDEKKLGEVSVHPALDDSRPQPARTSAGSDADRDSRLLARARAARERAS